MENKDKEQVIVTPEPETRLPNKADIHILFSITPHKLGGWQVVAYQEVFGDATQVFAGKDALKHHALGQLEDMLATYLVDFNGNAEKMIEYLKSEGGK